MLKKIHKTAIAIICVLIFLCRTSVFATSIEQESINKAGVIAIQATKNSTYMVTIPEKIVLNNQNICNYTIKVTGDLATDENICVVPAASLQLKQKDKPDIVAPIVQDKTIWKHADLSIDGNGMIKTEDILTGLWTGIFVFNIQKKKMG